MKRARPYKTASIVVGLVVGGFIALAACSNQGEGDRCDFGNGSDDCKTGEGLICYQAAVLTNTTSDRCCPLDRATATNAVCKAPVNASGVDAATPADTGPPTAATATVNDAAPAADASLD